MEILSDNESWRYLTVFLDVANGQAGCRIADVWGRWRSPDPELVAGATSIVETVTALCQLVSVHSFHARARDAIGCIALAAALKIPGCPSLADVEETVRVVPFMRKTSGFDVGFLVTEIVRLYADVKPCDIGGLWDRGNIGNIFDFSGVTLEECRVVASRHWLLRRRRDQVARTDDLLLILAGMRVTSPWDIDRAFSDKVESRAYGALCQQLKATVAAAGRNRKRKRCDGCGDQAFVRVPDVVVDSIFDFLLGDDDDRVLLKSTNHLVNLVKATSFATRGGSSHTSPFEMSASVLFRQLSRKTLVLRPKCLFDFDPLLPVPSMGKRLLKTLVPYAVVAWRKAARLSRLPGSRAGPAPDAPFAVVDVESFVRHQAFRTSQVRRAFGEMLSVFPALSLTCSAHPYDLGYRELEDLLGKCGNASTVFLRGPLAVRVLNESASGPACMQSALFIFSSFLRSTAKLVADVTTHPGLPETEPSNPRLGTEANASVVKAMMPSLQALITINGAGVSFGEGAPGVSVIHLETANSNS